MKEKALSPAQLKKLQTMFSKLGFEPEDKKALISLLTDGRATSTKDITFDEAKHLISHLSGETEPDKAAYQEQCRKVVGQIYRLSYEIGMSFGDTPEDKLMNCAKINKFCRERGTVKKNISEMNLQELRKTHRQFEAMFQNNIDRAVKQLVNNALNKKKNEKQKLVKE